MKNIIKHYSVVDNCIMMRLMTDDGGSFARGYYFNDDKLNYYLDELSISVSQRRMGVGSELQKLREDYAKSRGFKYTILWVKKGTWMRKWYKRRGYKYYKPNKEKNAVWLRKVI